MAEVGRSEARPTSAGLAVWAARALVTLSLFPLAALWRLFQERRDTVGRLTMIESRDYPGAVGVLNAGGLVFAAALAALFVLALGHRTARRRLLRILGVALALLVLQIAGLAVATAAILRARPPLGTGGWRPNAVELGTRVALAPTFSISPGGLNGGAPVEYDCREAEAASGVPLPPDVRVGLGPWLRAWGVESALDPKRRVLTFASFNDCWTDPYSSFDAPHPATPDSEASAFEMIPHQLTIRHADGDFGQRWAGEFRRRRTP